jgi:hypothetical protein
MIQGKIRGSQVSIGFTLIMGLASALVAGAQASATQPNDLVVAVDVSGSMSKSGDFEEVKDYLETEVLRPLLKPGDRFTLIPFGTTARVQPTRTIASAGDVDAAVAAIRNLKASDGHTDLGTAVEALESAMQARSDGAFRPVAVFLTDGKNAPPPESPFSGKDLSVDERFAGAGQRIAKKGWFLYVIGLGEQTDAATVAAVVEGSVLVESKEALEAESLETYLETTATATEERASVAAASGSAAPGADGTTADGKGGGSPAGVGGAGSPQAGGFPFALVVGAILGAALIVVIAVVLGRRKKKEEKEPDERP